ncbi:MAG: hypothetical protein E7460_09990 [Ruminococcaceae bacterium]|nr:hypothetical protein [Oscillospiraceae bacterium]
MKKTVLALLAAFTILLCTACSTPSGPEATSSDTSAATSASSEMTTAATLDTSASDTGISPTQTETLPETTLPPETEAPAPTYSFTFDPYLISYDYVTLYGPVFADTCRGLADAFINYETECFCPDDETFSALLGCVDICMPYFASDAILTYDSFDAETQTLTIHYLSDSKEAHDAAYQSFVDSVTAFIQPVLSEDHSQLERAIAVYRSFSSAVSYDLSAADVSAHGAIVNRRGIAHSFAGACAYLFRQAGIDAIVCGGLSSDGSAAHEWVTFSLDGKYYHADPTYENGETGGFGLSYFGTTNAERMEAGYSPDTCRVGYTGLITADTLAADHTEFDIFRGTTAFILVPESDTLNLSNGASVDLSALPGGAK